MALSGQKTVTTAGTAVQLGTQATLGGEVYIKALSTNTGLIYVGNDGAGDVASTNGFVLSKNEWVELDVCKVSSLASIIIDSSVNGEGVSWILTNVGGQE